MKTKHVPGFNQILGCESISNEVLTHGGNNAFKLLLLIYKGEDA